MTRKELMERRGQCEARAKIIVDRAEAAGRDLTPDEQSHFDAAMTEAEALQKRIENRTQLDTLSRELSRVEDYGLDHLTHRIGDGVTDDGGSALFINQATGEPVRAYGAGERLTARHPGGHPIGDFVTGLLTGRVLNQNVGSSDASGGYLLNPELSTFVLDLARSASVVLRAGGRTIPMETSELRIAKIEADPTATWRAEAAAIPASHLTFGRIDLKPKTLAAIVPVSIELLEDADNAGAIIEAALRAAMGLALDKAALIGTGTGSEPLGITGTTGVNTVSGIGTPANYSHVSQAVEAILQANYPGDPSGLAWVMHPRDGATYDGLVDSTGQPLQPTPWAGALQKFATTSLPTNQGAGTNESTMIVGSFPELIVGMRTTGVAIRVLDAGTVTDGVETINAAEQLMRLVVAYLRADVAVLRPTWFTKLIGVLA